MSNHENLSYKRTVLFGADAFEIVSCEWTHTSVSALHNHGWSQCVVLIQEGTFENRADFALKSELSVLEAGQVIYTPTGVEHEIRCLSPVGKTLHVYLPKITAQIEKGHFSPGTLTDVRRQLDIQLSASGIRWADLERLLNQVSEQSISTHSPLFMNQLFSGIFPETLAAEKLTAQAKTTMATFEASPAFTAIELEVIDRLGEQIGWAADRRDGIGVPGGSAANFMAVHCARQKRFPGYRRQGLRGERLRVFGSREAHYSLKKACLATGLGTDGFIEVAVDSTGAMDPVDLRAKIEASIAQREIPLLVCATAGTTVHGAFDPIEPLAKICQEFSIWLHVDGAWGAPVLFSSTARELMRGIEHADSLTFDAHKLFGANLTCSFFVNRHRGLLLEANDVAGGDYIFHTSEISQDRGRLSWQCGRPPDALSFWTLWKSQGTAGLGAFVDRQLRLREDCARWIQTQERLEIVGAPTYLNLCVRVLPPAGAQADPNWSKWTREQLKLESLAMVNFAQDQQGTFLRLIFAHPKLNLQHVQWILTQALAVR